MAQIWRLKKGAEGRIRGGHPWVLENELQAKPQRFNPQEPVELQDWSGKFLARGYGNPESRIVFRVMSFSSQDGNPLAPESLRKKVLQAWKKRHELGFRRSFRLCFSEGDEMSGLIVDRYLVETKAGLHQVFAIQVLTAGMQRALPDLLTFFKELCESSVQEGLSEYSWDQTSLVLRNDVSIRKLEGLLMEFPRFLKISKDFEPDQSWILVDSVSSPNSISMNCDLYQGQKTGFFLDQTANIRTVADFLKTQQIPNQTFRILDLCSYVGHWSVQIGTLMKLRGIPCQSTMVDVSNEALGRAQKNMTRAGLDFEFQKLDVLKGLGVFPDQSFDLVIADPPAFVKSKKDLPIGRHAYQKLNTQAVRLVKPGGFVVSCSCSGLIKEADLEEAFQKALVKNQRTAQLVGRGGPALDHPRLPGFTEGAYLKMLFHSVN